MPLEYIGSMMGLAQTATGAQTCFFLEQKVHAWVMQPLTCEMQCVSPFSMQGLQQSCRLNQTGRSMANVNDNAHLTEGNMCHLPLLVGG